MCTKDFLQMFIVKCSFPTNEVILNVQPTLENKFIRKKKLAYLSIAVAALAV